MSFALGALVAARRVRRTWVTDGAHIAGNESLSQVINNLRAEVDRLSKANAQMFKLNEALAQEVTHLNKQVVNLEKDLAFFRATCPTGPSPGRFPTAQG